MPNIVTIDFHGDRLLGIETDGEPLIPLKPLVIAMGLDWSAQLKRAKRDPITAAGMAMMATPSDQEAVCLPLDLVPGFLFRIDASRVAEPMRARVLDYQRHCYAVLARAFLRPAETCAPLSFDARTLDAKRRVVREARLIHGIAAAQRVWFAIGLPIVEGMREPPAQGSLPLSTAEH